MDAALSTLVILGLMGGAVVLFRRIVRPPSGVSQEDSPSVRTMVVFSGDDPRFFQDDEEDEPLVGVCLFHLLCDGLEAAGVRIEHRGRLQNAQRAECVVERERLALVLERIDDRWVASVEWVPKTAAERRHLALTHQVFAPPDSDPLRKLLRTLDDWLKAQPGLGNVRWHRKERWMVEDLSDPSDGPIQLT
jgi:hypothetical protein